MHRGFEALRIGAVLHVVAITVTAAPAALVLARQRAELPGWLTAVLALGIVVAWGLALAGARGARTVRLAAQVYAVTVFAGILGFGLLSDVPRTGPSEPWIHGFIATAIALSVLVSRRLWVAMVVAAAIVVADAWLHATVWASESPGLAYHLTMQVALFAVGSALLAAAAAEQRAVDAEEAALAERFLAARAAEQMGRRGAQWDALVHDEILAALETIGRQSPDVDDRAVAAQALQHLEAGPPTGALDGTAFRAAVLETMLAEYPSSSSRFVTAPDACPLPPEVADALLMALSEALRNAATHAYPGSTRGEVVVHLDHSATRLRLTITDRGIGFDRARVRRASLGLSLSIEGRMGAVGGTGTVSSRPGSGTSVTLRWTAEDRR